MTHPQSPSPSVDEVAERREALLTILRDAVAETAKRPPGRRGPYVFDEAELQALASELASLVSPPKAGSGEPVAWRGKYRAETKWRYFDHPFDGFDPDKYELEPLYANHEARGDGVRVKALEWEELTSAREDGPAEPTGDWNGFGVTGAYCVYIFDDHYEVTRPDGEYVEHHLGDPDEAKAAAQLDYETHIRSALEAALPPLGDGSAEIVEALKEALPYVEQAVNDDGGIDNCEIGDRLTLERVRAAIRSLSNPGGSE